MDKTKSDLKKDNKKDNTHTRNKFDKTYKQITIICSILSLAISIIVSIIGGHINLVMTKRQYMANAEGFIPTFHIQYENKDRTIIVNNKDDELFEINKVTVEVFEKFRYEDYVVDMVRSLDFGIYNSTVENENKETYIEFNMDEENCTTVGCMYNHGKASKIIYKNLLDKCNTNNRYSYDFKNVGERYLVITISYSSKNTYESDKRMFRCEFNEKNDELKSIDAIGNNDFNRDKIVVLTAHGEDFSFERMWYRFRNDMRKNMLSEAGRNYNEYMYNSQNDTFDDIVEEPM